MCTPLIGGLISTGLSIAGSAINAQQQAAYVDAQNQAQRDAAAISQKARQDELGRQKKLEEEANSYFDKSLQSVAPEARQQKQAEAESKFTAQLDARPNALDGQYLSGQQGADQEVTQEIARRSAETTADTKRRVAALAKLTAFGAADTANSGAISDTNNMLNTIGGIRRGSLGVSNFEQNISPAQVTKGSSMLGDIISGVGGLGARMAGQSYGKSGGSLF